MNQNHEINQYEFIKKLKSLPFVKQIILYGSRARKTNQSRSDIDIAIICPNATNDQWLEILDIIYEADTLLLIDCVRFDQLKDNDFKSNILKEGIIL